MKTLLILILLLALLAAAFFTRPSKESFTGYFNDTHKTDGGNFFEQLSKQHDKEKEFSSLTFKDRILWVEMDRDGKAQYIGAFSHWFDRTEPMHPAPALPAK